MVVGGSVEGSVSPRSNKLLELLPDEAYAHLLPQLEAIRIPVGGIVHEPGQTLRYAVFPVSGLIGRVAMTAEGKSTELTLCGCDGMIGASIFLGGRPLLARALVLAEVTAFRLSAPAMLSAWRTSEAFQGLMLRYVQAMLQEVIQIALCNKHHSVEQQFSRWLLMAGDRLNEPRMAVTQSVISHMLGVRREGITEAAGRLEAQGIVKRERGGMMIVDRRALQERCCECYGAITTHFQRMMSDARIGAFRHWDVERYVK
jgi:CRP-like cAMP-binding protein